MRVPLELAVRAASATLIDGDTAPATLRVSTDTRAIERGDTFVALRGERFDGHDFVAEAAQRGAALLVVDRPEARLPGLPTLLVADTRLAYMALAGAARSLFANRVLAITGSAGKTTTKAFLATLLAAKHGDRVLSAPGNENNEIGVSKLLLRASNDAHDVLVVEMGARHYGDIAALVAIARPHFGILTNVGEAHLEIMGSHERLEETKWALFSQGARPILNADDPVSRRRAASLEQRVHWFAARENASVDPSLLGELTSLTMLAGDRLFHCAGERREEHRVEVRVPGLHNRANLAAAIAGAIELGVPIADVLPELGRLQLPEGRYDRIPLGGIRLIYDAYNANASSMMAALDAFAAETAARRIAVLASMAELGDESKTLHERVGAHAAARVDTLLVRGEYASDLARGAQSAGLGLEQIVLVESNAQAARWLREHVRPQDVVLLKGSRKYKLEEIVQELRT
ncbi:MAG: UDP-N-acetylmuramoyl-tripeptide--D-alanyl-D-alanine ligase [Candidatus Eremiobacteraeota bacterium]|nr:UDP-N-acetylmuramoyl-tripeptide--D-alanyl-D-alanine ligase [Candidatus Eremiobacteraeota bacterium]